MEKTERAEDIDMSRLALGETKASESTTESIESAAADDTASGSHHRPKLYINTSPLVGEAENIVHTETDQYSITPKRFTSRSFFSDKPVETLEDVTVNSLLTQPGFLFYRDTYSHTSWVSDIHRFGVNPHNMTIREDLLQHNQVQNQRISDSGQFTKSKASNASSHGVYRTSSAYCF